MMSCRGDDLFQSPLVQIQSCLLRFSISYFYLLLLITVKPVLTERSGRLRFFQFQVTSRCVSKCSCYRKSYVCYNKLSSYLHVLFSFILY